MSQLTLEDDAGDLRWGESGLELLQNCERGELSKAGSGTES